MGGSETFEKPKKKTSDNHCGAAGGAPGNALCGSAGTLAGGAGAVLFGDAQVMAALAALVSPRRRPRQARTAKRYSKAATPARLNARATACSRGQRAPPWRGVLLDSLALMLAAAKAQQGIVVQRAWRA